MGLLKLGWKASFVLGLITLILGVVITAEAAAGGPATAGAGPASPATQAGEGTRQGATSQGTAGDSWPASRNIRG